MVQEQSRAVVRTQNGHDDDGLSVWWRSCALSRVRLPSASVGEGAVATWRKSRPVNGLMVQVDSEERCGEMLLFARPGQI